MYPVSVIKKILPKNEPIQKQLKRNMTAMEKKVLNNDATTNVIWTTKKGIHEL